VGAVDAVEVTDTDDGGAEVGGDLFEMVEESHGHRRVIPMELIWGFDKELLTALRLRAGRAPGAKKIRTGREEKLLNAQSAENGRDGTQRKS
jgi:hypothetical protein